MAPLVLEGVTLGERHRHYNKLLKEAIDDESKKLDPIDYKDNDIDNLMRIDVACKTRNVQYILEVLKGEDLLYVSRVLKQSKWLVTEPQYAHIINPEHLQTELFPHMTTKAINKVMLHIRTHLKDEKRVEEFFTYKLKTNQASAFKWLPNCSLAFKLEVAKAHDVPLHIFKRIYKKDPECIIEHIKRCITRQIYPTNVARLLAKSHPDEFINVLNQLFSYDSQGIKCGVTTTDVMLKKCSERIINGFSHYVDIVDLPTIVKYLKRKSDVKKFLYDQSQYSWKPLWFTFDNLKYFLDEIPQEHTTRLLKRMFLINDINDTIDTSEEDNISDGENDSSNDADTSEGDNGSDDEKTDEDNNSHNENNSSNGADNYNSDADNDKNEIDSNKSTSCEKYDENKYDRQDVKKPMALSEVHAKIAATSHPHLEPPHLWYRFAPFEDAKRDLQKLIYAELSPKMRHSLLLTLLACARRCPAHIRTVLQYYHDRHINEGYSYKAKFVNHLITQIGVHNLDQQTWNILDSIFRSMQLYIESNKKSQACIKTIIIYKILHDESIPEIIEAKFKIDPLKKCNQELNLTDKNKIFEYLYNLITQKIQKQNIKFDTGFQESVTLVKKLWKLIVEWKKEDQYYKVIVTKIKELLVSRKDNNLNVNMSTIYNMLGPRRRELFTESLSLSANEETCLNALKHSPQLLDYHHNELHVLRAADSATPRRLFTKLRIYWPNTIANEWANEYFSHVNDTTGHKAIIKGLYLLLPSHKLITFIKQHAPEDKKIEWAENNELQTNIRRQIAKHMHFARPPLPTEVVVWYAKGDYLQYAQLSLNSIYYNLKTVQVNEHIKKLLTGPVSVQKHGIRQAYEKLKPEELITLYYRLWRNSRNCTIRAVLFTCTFKLLYKESDENLIKDLWKLMDTYIKELNEHDNKIIFNTLGNVINVPFSVKAKFLMKSYTFLKSLPEKADCEAPISRLVTNAPNLMEYLDPDFVSDILLDSAYENILQGKEMYIGVLSAYILCTNDKDIQYQRFVKHLFPVLDAFISLWVKERNQTIRAVIVKIFESVCGNVPKYVFEKEMQMPIEIIDRMYTMLVKKLSPQYDYVLLTNGHLTFEYITLLENLMKTSERKYTWIDIQKAAITPFGKIWFKHLKKNIDIYFSSIYNLYAIACTQVFSNYQIDEIIQLDIILSSLEPEVVESYLVGLTFLPSSFSWTSYERREKLEELSQIIADHPSLIVKMLHSRHFQRN